MKPFELLAHAQSPDGTVIELKRRGDEYVIETILNGVALAEKLTAAVATA